MCVCVCVMGEWEDFHERSCLKSEGSRSVGRPLLKSANRSQTHPSPYGTSHSFMWRKLKTEANSWDDSRDLLFDSSSRQLCDYSKRASSLIGLEAVYCGFELNPNSSLFFSKCGVELVGCSSWLSFATCAVRQLKARPQYNFALLLHDTTALKLRDLV